MQACARDDPARLVVVVVRRRAAIDQYGEHGAAHGAEVDDFAAGLVTEVIGIVRGKGALVPGHRHAFRGVRTIVRPAELDLGRTWDHIFAAGVSVDDVAAGRGRGSREGHTAQREH
jgi:ribosomal protein L3